MQFKAYFAIFSALIYLCVQVDAACNCDAADSTCLQKCVTEGQSCITECSGDNSCYDGCIKNFWPGQSETSAITTINVASSTTSASVVASASATVSASSTTAAASVVGSASSAAPSVVPSASSLASVSSVSNVPTFHPTTAAAPTQPISGANSKSFLMPAVAIGAASIAVVMQFF